VASTAIVHNTAHVVQGVANFTTQFRDKPRLAALVTSWLTQCQALENVLWDLLTLRMLDNPLTAGAQLDVIGNVVGQQREGLADADYIQFLRARIKANSSDGRLETLIEILQLILGTSAVISARDYPPKSLVLEVDGVTPNAWIIFNEFLRPAKAPGDNLMFIYSPSAATATITLTSSWSAATVTTTQRFGSSYVGGTGGGVLAGIFGGES
jgi:hypothetical protein